MVTIKKVTIESRDGVDTLTCAGCGWSQQYWTDSTNWRVAILHSCYNYLLLQQAWDAIDPPA